MLTLFTPFFIKRCFFKDYKLYFCLNSKNFYSFLYFLKNHSVFHYKLLVDIVVIDLPEKKNRFTLVYSLLSSSYSSRVNVVVSVAEMKRFISIKSLFRGADWAEREVWDMFGISFYKHLGLKRILTDYGFSGFPLRKDFPLSGFIELWYNHNEKKLNYNRIVLAQEYRNFWFDHYTSYWGFQNFNLHTFLIILVQISNFLKNSLTKKRYFYITFIQFSVWKDVFKHFWLPELTKS